VHELHSGFEFGGFVVYVVELCLAAYAGWALYFLVGWPAALAIALPIAALIGFWAWVLRPPTGRSQPRDGEPE
jgi:hypothetical protein